MIRVILISEACTPFPKIRGGGGVTMTGVVVGGDDWGWGMGMIGMGVDGMTGVGVGVDGWDSIPDLKSVLRSAISS